MRYFLYPRLRKGMDARYRIIKGGHDEAEPHHGGRRSPTSPSTRRSWQPCGRRPSERIEAARAVLDAERSRPPGGGQRPHRRAAGGGRHRGRSRPAPPPRPRWTQAVRAVASRVGELALGRQPDPNVVSSAVAEVTGAGVGSMNAVIAQVLVPLLQHLPRAEGDLDDSGNYTTTTG